MTPGSASWVQRAVIVAVVSLSVISLHAQVDTGSILGTVTDPSGAVITGAKVTLTNLGTNSQLSTTTGADGTYKFSPVRIGSYKIDVTSQGFQSESQRDIAVDVSSNVLVNFKLRPGSVTEVVDVPSTAPVLETQSAAVGQVVDSRNVDSLPLNGRNFTFLAQLAAGVNSPQADTRGNAASGAFAANGLRPAQNNYLLDGIDNNSDTVDFLNGTNFVVLPPVDAIQEFRVQTSDFSAEYGRSGAAVLNATIKSGTNSLHGTIWEFLRNDKLDAADYFERTCAGTGPCQTHKGELRQNQFGFSAGGPVVIPKLFNGRDKVFFFADYEGLRRIQGTILTGSVPTAAERSSNYTDLSDLITGQSGNARTDLLGRSLPLGTILDPATTRAVTKGQVDPVSGLVATNSGYVRDPFGTCSPGTASFSLAACNLNHLPANRLDVNAIKLLNLYPQPAGSGLFSNFTNSPKLNESRNSFDSRMDVNFSQKDQTFFRFSLVDDPIFIPSIFGGVADGGGFFQGNQTALAEQAALAHTHVFSPNLVNVARVGINYLHTTRSGPVASDVSNIPGQYGIQGIPQVQLNGGLPAFVINGLQTLGSNAFLPSDEVSSTIQTTDDLTKIYGKHTFKMGFEFQHVKFSTLQPPYSHGQFNFDNGQTDIAGGGTASNTGRAQFLLIPTTSTVPGGVNYVGGANQVQLSNISQTDNGKNYYGTYINDDWKATQKLTLNVGLRWDFFGLVFEHHHNQANFVPGGVPTGAPMYIIPNGPNANNLSTSFKTLLAQDGIQLAITDQYGAGLGNSQKTNFAPRLGFAYQVTPKLVARGGFGLFYNGFENRGFSPNLGENYPFQFNFNFQATDDHTPVTFPGCSTAGPGGTAVLETGFSCTPLSPLSVNASGLALRGIQFDYATPYSMGGNFTLQYELSPSLAVQAGYVTSLGRHLEVFPGSNQVTQILGQTLPIVNGTQTTIKNFLPFPDFARGSSYAITEGSSHYHGLQTKIEKRFAGGLSFLGTYTWSQVRSDATDLLNNGSLGGYRAPAVPGFGIRGDYGLASFDIRNVFHFSGNYQLPFGKGKRYLDVGGPANALLGGWTMVWSTTLQGGQPITLRCPSGTTTATSCNDLLVKGQDPYAGPHNVTQFLNPQAFTQPCILASDGTPTSSPSGCVPLTGLAALGGPQGQVTGPGFHRLDFSTFKEFPFKERFRLQFRAEFFNILNHPNFNSPGFGGNGVVAISGATNYTSSNFGKIGSTRDAPYDPRQVQFALKLYY